MGPVLQGLTWHAAGFKVRRPIQWHVLASALSAQARQALIREHRETSRQLRVSGFWVEARWLEACIKSLNSERRPRLLPQLLRRRRLLLLLLLLPQQQQVVVVVVVVVAVVVVVVVVVVILYYYYYYCYCYCYYYYYYYYYYYILLLLLATTPPLPTTWRLNPSSSPSSTKMTAAEDAGAQDPYL